MCVKQSVEWTSSKREKGSSSRAFITLHRQIKTKREKKKEHKIKNKLSHSWPYMYYACPNHIIYCTHTHKKHKYSTIVIQFDVWAIGHGLCLIYHVVHSVHSSRCSRWVLCVIPLSSLHVYTSLHAHFRFYILFCFRSVKYIFRFLEIFKQFGFGRFVLLLMCSIFEIYCTMNGFFLRFFVGISVRDNEN